MNLSIAQKAFCEELGIRAKEVGGGEYVLAIQDVEIYKGNEKEIFAYLDQLLDAQDTILQEKVGKAIKALREQNEISAADFAYSILKSPEELNLIENGRMIPDDDTLNLLSNMFGVSLLGLKQGEIRELKSRSEIRDILKNIEQLLEEIRRDNAYLKNFIQKWNLSEIYEQNKGEKKETLAEEEAEIKYSGETLTRYIATKKNNYAAQTSGEEQQNEYYVIVDTYTGEVVSDINGMEKQFANEAAALAYAAMLEKQAEPEAYLNETPDYINDFQDHDTVMNMKI